MPNQTDKILNEIETERLRRENLTLEELREIYNKLVEQNFPDAERIRFIADLGDCREIAYHYELICKEWEDGSKLNLSSSFDKISASLSDPTQPKAMITFCLRLLSLVARSETSSGLSLSQKSS